MSPWRLRQIAQQLRNGAVIAYPTDTIWGFGCHPMHAKAIQRIQRLKQRAANKGLILLSSSLEYCSPYIDDKAYEINWERLQQPQPSPTTWIIKASENCPSWLTGQFDTVAIRLTDKPQIQNLCDPIATPLVSTSANLSGRNTAANRFIVHKHFHHQVDFIIEGFITSAQQASRIRDVQSGKTLRP